MKERISFYKYYKYLIGGELFTLEDIEHGVLRSNDNFGTSLISVISFLLRGRGSGKRFQQND